MTTAPSTYRVETVTERQLAKTIDHSLLRPELDDAFVEAGCRLAAEYDVASVCVDQAYREHARRVARAIDQSGGE
jgi:deoxyribose-phosphate aldolase